MSRLPHGARVCVSGVASPARPLQPLGLVARKHWCHGSAPWLPLGPQHALPVQPREAEPQLWACEEPQAEGFWGSP